MFDQEQQKLLRHSLAKLKQDYSLNSNVYGVSAFDANFDQELKKLVIFYSFDFEAIALHLSYKFHQYSHRLKPQAVSYRWYQLTVSDKAGNQEQDIQQFPKKQDVQKQAELEEQQNKMKEQSNEEIVFFSLQQKLQQLQAAMLKAKQLDQQENQTLMFYRPKFIMDSQFKLERQPINAFKDLKPFMENELIVEFGNFSPPQTAPFNILIEEYDQAAPHVQQPHKQQEQEDTEFLDDDWEAYQSD